MNLYWYLHSKYIYEMQDFVEIHIQSIQISADITQSIPYLLIVWQHKDPGHQQTK